MTKMFAINARYVPPSKDGWESSGIESPTFYLHPNAQGILNEEGAKVIAGAVFASLLERAGGELHVHATEVDV
jgi:hypothetical protein